MINISNKCDIDFAGIKHLQQLVGGGKLHFERSVRMLLLEGGNLRCDAVMEREIDRPDDQMVRFLKVDPFNILLEGTLRLEDRARVRNQRFPVRRQLDLLCSALKQAYSIEILQLFDMPGKSCLTDLQLSGCF